MKTRLKNYLSITKKEWNGLVILVALIALVLVAPYAYQLFHKDAVIDLKDFDRAAAQLSKAGTASGFDPEKEKPKAVEKVQKTALFPFDPNSVTEIQLQQLGLTLQQAETLIHYRQKGGSFSEKEDLKKVYTISKEDYDRLAPYIYMPEAAYTKLMLSHGKIVELNTADSAMLTNLKGVGPASAVLIIRNRGRLGGFMRKVLLQEVYGIDSARYKQIEAQVSVNPGKIKKIAINTISFDQLRLFPYLNYKQGNAIIEYRREHGNYTSMEDMKNIVLLDDKILRKIEPYISFQ